MHFKPSSGENQREDKLHCQQKDTKHSKKVVLEVSRKRKLQSPWIERGQKEKEKQSQIANAEQRERQNHAGSDTNHRDRRSACRKGERRTHVLEGVA
jgi:hypothetical protein